MFIGHYALGLASKRVAPGVSLGALFLACQFADLLWPTLVMAGLESLAIRPGATAVTPLDFEHYPYSHSLLALVVWGTVLGLVYRRVTGSSWRAAAVLFTLVLSHWVLDVIVHRADLPLAPGSDYRIGLGLWNSVPGTLAVEFVLFALGAVAYLKSTVALDRIGSIGTWMLLLFLSIVELGNVLGAAASKRPRCHLVSPGAVARCGVGLLGRLPPQPNSWPARTRYSALKLAFANDPVRSEVAVGPGNQEFQVRAAAFGPKRLLVTLS